MDLYITKDLVPLTLCVFVYKDCSVTKMVEMLLARCVHEVDVETRNLLGILLGEMGAIGDHRLGSIRMSDTLGISDSLDSSDSTWRLARPPHVCRKEEYGLKLISKHLVVALQGAPNTDAQHKIAYAIQQLLVLLNKISQANDDIILCPKNQDTDTTKRGVEMCQELKDKLEKTGVLQTIEPYWTSEFQEVSKCLDSVIDISSNASKKKVF